MSCMSFDIHKCRDQISRRVVFKLILAKKSFFKMKTQNPQYKRLLPLKKRRGATQSPHCPTTAKAPSETRFLAQLTFVKVKEKEICHRKSPLGEYLYLGLPMRISYMPVFDLFLLQHSSQTDTLPFDNLNFMSKYSVFLRRSKIP